MITLTVPRLHDLFFPTFQFSYLLPFHCILDWQPLISNRVRIGAVAQPFQDIDIKFLEAFPSDLCSMWWSIILLESLTVWKIGSKFQQMLHQDFAIFAGHRWFHPEKLAVFFLESWFHPKLSAGEEYFGTWLLVFLPLFPLGSIELKNHFVWKYCGLEGIIQMFVTPLNPICLHSGFNNCISLGTSLR